MEMGPPAGTPAQVAFSKLSKYCTTTPPVKSEPDMRCATAPDTHAVKTTLPNDTGCDDQ